MSDHGTVHREVTAGNVSESADSVSVNEFVESGDIDQSDEDGDKDQREEETKDEGENSQRVNKTTTQHEGCRDENVNTDDGSGAINSGTPAVLETLKKQQTYTLASLTKCRNKLAGLMTNADNLHLVKDDLENLNILYQAYEDAHTEYREALSSDAE